jgi:hypothetical protein
VGVSHVTARGDCCLGVEACGEPYVATGARSRVAVSGGGVAVGAVLAEELKVELP